MKYPYFLACASPTALLTCMGAAHSALHPVPTALQQPLGLPSLLTYSLSEAVLPCHWDVAVLPVLPAVLWLWPILVQPELRAHVLISGLIQEAALQTTAMVFGSVLPSLLPLSCSLK